MSWLKNHWHGATIERHSLSQPLRAASSLREGAGKRSHSTGYSLKSGGAGDFHRPYETLMILAYTIQRTTLPQSALRADSSLREGAGRERTIQRAARKPQGCGRFSSPLRELRGFDILPFIRPHSPGMGYRFSNLFAPLVSSQRVSAAESAPNSAATAARYPFAPITFRVR